MMKNKDRSKKRTTSISIAVILITIIIAVLAGNARSEQTFITGPTESSLNSFE